MLYDRKFAYTSPTLASYFTINECFFIKLATGEILMPNYKYHIKEKPCFIIPIPI